MKIIDGSCSLVIVGKWNRYLLTPEWVGKNLFHEETIEVEFPINRPDLAPRYKTKDNIMFLPAVHRCQFIAPEPYDDKILEKICVYSKKLIEILNHTPVSALGINLGFEASIDEFENIELFSLSDSDALIDEDYVTKTIEIKRQFEINEKLVNLSITKTPDTISFDFNYHTDIDDTKNFTDLLSDDQMKKNKNESIKMLSLVYNLTLDEEE